MTYTDIMDLHTHTIASSHAYNTIYEMAAAASRKGVALLGITDHGPNMPGSKHQSYFNNFKMLPRELYGVKVMFGCELDILDYNGSVDLPERILRKQDYVVASLHKNCCTPGTMAENTQAYLNVMKHPKVSIIGHPDDTAYPVDYETLVHAAKEYHVLLEVNSNSLHPRCVRSGARENYAVMLEWCKKLQAPIVINSDAHCEIDVGNHGRVHAMLEELDFPQELVANRSLDAAAAYIPFLRRLLDGELTPMEAAL